jgi:hypothetical protein
MKLSQRDIETYQPHLRKYFPEADLSKVRVFQCRAIKIPYYLYNRWFATKYQMSDLITGFALGNRVFVSEPYSTELAANMTMKHLVTHELVHCCQFQKYGFAGFLCRHSRESRAHGFVGMYATPGTLEYEAEEIASAFCAEHRMRQRTKNRSEFHTLIDRLSKT